MRKCEYRKCWNEFEPTNGRQVFCCRDHRIKEWALRQYEQKTGKLEVKSRGTYVINAHNPARVKRKKIKICRTPGCNNPVGAGLYWLCDQCYKYGDVSVEEHAVNIVTNVR